jgi:hypothetical protein
MSPQGQVRRAQRGQSTVEFAVLALVLVPLVLSVPLLGKYLDLMQATEQASRYVAFEGMAHNSSNGWRSDAELALEVRRRFFSASAAPIKTNDAAGDFGAHRNPLWTDTAGRPLLDNFGQQVGVGTQVNGYNAIAATTLWAGALALSRDNLYTGSVTVTPVDVAGFEPFDTIGLRISRKTVLLADAWTARSPAGIRSKIEGATGMLPLDIARPLVNMVGILPALLFDPRLELNNFDWDIVPCDRLSGGC